MDKATAQKQKEALLSRDAASGLAASLALHASVVLGLLIVGPWMLAKDLSEESQDQVYWVKLDKLAEKSKAPDITKPAKRLVLKSSKPKREPVQVAKVAKPKALTPKLEIAKVKVERAQPEKNQQSASAGGKTNTQSVGGQASLNAAESAGPARASYEQAVLQKLEQAKNYPAKALRRRLEGDVLLNLSVASSGHVLKSQIEDSSGFDFFDQEVLAMVKRVGSFPPFPNDMSATSLNFQVPVSFRLKS